MKPKAFIRWWLLWSLVGVGLALALAHDEGMATELNSWGWLALLLSTAPLIGAQLALGSPAGFAQVKTWIDAQGPRAIRWVVAGLSLMYVLGNARTRGLDPYAGAIFVIGLWAALGAWREARGPTALRWTDIAVWMLLWIPFDLRWHYDLWTGLEGLKYAWWAIALTVVAVLGWYGFRAWPEFGYRLVPRWRDAGVALVLTALFAALVIPIGLAIDFLHFPPRQVPSVFTVAAAFVGLFLTVALPEEVFFRGILLHGLDRTWQRGWASLLVSSLAFGLMHWNNASDLTTRVAYIALATLAGIFYGLAYRRSGNNVLAAVLTHTLVDVIWRFGFQ